jgi:RES domain-containing protein
MKVYRITLAKWAGSLEGSGRAARWNSNGFYVVYTASSRALACLENIVHRHSIGRNEAFKIASIDIPERLTIADIDLAALPPNWTDYIQYPACQVLGNQWLESNKTPVLRVPSALIPEEFNYLINLRHPDTKDIKIPLVEPFSFDERLMDPHK